MHATRRHAPNAQSMKKLASWVRRLSTSIERQDFQDMQVCFDAALPYGLKCRWMSAEEAAEHQRPEEAPQCPGTR